MKKKLLYSGIALLIINQLCGAYARRYHYMDADGFLHESLAIPIGAFSLLLGVLALLGALALYGLGYFKQA